MAAHTEGHADGADDDQQEAGHHPATQRGLGQRHVVSQCGDGRDPRGPPRGEVRRHDGHHQAHGVRRDHGARLQEEGRTAQVEPERSEQCLQTAGQQVAEAQAQRRADQTDEHRLHEHGDVDLPAGCAERAQQRELPRALRHQDRERVDDEVRAHHQGDRREHQQERVQEAQDLVEPRLVLLHQRVAGAGHDAGGQHPLCGIAQPGLGDAGCGVQRDSGVGVLAAEERLLHEPIVEDRQRRAVEATGPELDEPGDRRLDRGRVTRRHQRDPVADGVPGLASGVDVEGDLRRAVGVVRPC